MLALLLWGPWVPGPCGEPKSGPGAGGQGVAGSPAKRRPASSAVSSGRGPGFSWGPGARRPSLALLCLRPDHGGAAIPVVAPAWDRVGGRGSSLSWKPLKVACPCVPARALLSDAPHATGAPRMCSRPSHGCRGCRGPGCCPPCPALGGSDRGAPLGCSHVLALSLAPFLTSCLTLSKFASVSSLVKGGL